MGLLTLPGRGKQRMGVLGLERPESLTTFATMDCVRTLTVAVCRSFRMAPHLESLIVNDVLRHKVNSRRRQSGK